MDDFELGEEMRDAQRAAWHRYLDRVAPFRPLLHGYCRRLTRSIWDAEDLVQDTLLRGFHSLSLHHDPIGNPRAYLLRIATHGWIDTVRRREAEGRALDEAGGAGASEPAPGAVRDAGQTLLQRLAPRERAAVLLKDLFEMSLEESAEVLGTSVGAVKSALHRGRERLREPVDAAVARRPAPASPVVERFVALFNAEDREGLIALVLDNAEVGNVGIGRQYGADSLRGKHSWVHGALGRHPDWPVAFRFESQRLEAAEVDGERALLHFRTRGGEEALEGLLRVSVADGHIAELESYGFCPEMVRAAGEQCGVPVRTGLYRYPTPEPGRFFGDGGDG